MQRFSEAKVADILRSTQRDELFIAELQDSIQLIFKSLGAKNYHTFRGAFTSLSTIWYYFLTSLGNLQTLGEEYAGILRVNRGHGVPDTLVQVTWLCLHLGGEALVDRLLASVKTNVERSDSLTERARSLILKTVEFVKNNKQTIKRMHHSLFYIDGIYYHLSNRVTGIRYILVRHWLEDNTFTRSFRLLGQISLVYAVCNFLHDLWTSKSNGNIAETVSVGVGLSNRSSGKECVLCTETRKNPCATPCGHIFCWDCIYDSLNYQQNCPICREVISPSRIVFLQNYL